MSSARNAEEKSGALASVSGGVVYLDVEVKAAGYDDGVGKVVGLYTKGWLPYTLRWQFRVTASDPPNGFALQYQYFSWQYQNNNSQWTANFSQCRARSNNMRCNR